MAEYCVVQNVDGKRDFTQLRARAPKEARGSVDKCVASESEDGVPDWQDVAECARDQISGLRDYLLFERAAANKEELRALAGCAKAATDAEDRVVDWDDAVRCAARGTAPGEPDEEPESIVVT